eukprot:1371418-Karenia_brevis.AAC.1
MKHDMSNANHGANADDHLKRLEMCVEKLTNQNTPGDLGVTTPNNKHGVDPASHSLSGGVGQGPSQNTFSSQHDISQDRFDDMLAKSKVMVNMKNEVAEVRSTVTDVCNNVTSLEKKQDAGFDRIASLLTNRSDTPAHVSTPVNPSSHAFTADADAAKEAAEEADRNFFDTIFVDLALHNDFVDKMGFSKLAPSVTKAKP